MHKSRVSEVFLDTNTYQTHPLFHRSLSCQLNNALTLSLTQDLSPILISSVLQSVLRSACLPYNDAYLLPARE